MTSERRERATDAAAIVVAWSFAIAQPLLDVLGKNPEFFVAHSATTRDILAFAIGITLVAPLILAGIITLIGLVSAVAGRIVHRIVLGLLVAEFVLQLLKNIAALPGLVQIVVPLTLGFGVAWLYDHRAGLRRSSWWFAPAPLIFLVLFLASPVNALIFTEAVTSDSDVRIGNPRPVVVVVFDEFPVVSLLRPDGTLDRAAYPNFARLADRSTWFPNTTADWPTTEHSVPTILTGRIRTGSVATASANPKSIFTMLGGAYAVDAWEPVTKLCPTAICTDTEAGLSTGDRVDALVDDTQVVAGHVLLPDPLADDLPGIDQSWGNFGDDGDAGADDASSASVESSKDSSSEGSAEVSEEATSKGRLASLDPGSAVDRFVANLHTDGRHPDGRPELGVLHVETPHVPWHYLPNGQQYASGDTIPGVDNDGWGSDEGLTILGRSRHLLQVQYVDRLLGAILDRLDATSLGRRAVVVVTADHGVAFQPSQGRRGAKPNVLGDIAYVPLFISVPGHPAGTDRRPARLDDIVPTIADALDARTDGWKFDGTSLLGSDHDGSRTRSITGQNGTRIEIGPGTRALGQALARKWETFPGATSLADSHRLFAVGPLGPYVGDAAPGATPLNGGSVTFDQQSDLDTVTPDGPLVPSLLTGSITGVDGSADLLVTLNGTAIGVGRANDGDLAALIDPAKLHAGANDIGVLIADRDGGSTRFASISGGSTMSWSLASGTAGASTLTRSDGRSFVVVPGAFEGYTDSTTTGQVVTIHGWAVTVPTTGAPVSIVLFSNGEFLAATETHLLRRGVAEAKGPAYLYSGWASTFPRSRLGDPAANEISAYAVSDAGATELRYVGDFEFRPRR